MRIDQDQRLGLLDFLGKPLTWFLIGVILHSINLIYVDFSPDSMHFVDLGRNFAGGLGLVTYNLNLTSESIPAWITFFPSLYPLLLSIGFKLGMGAAGAARVVSLLSFIVIFVSVYSLGRKLRSSETGVLSVMVWLLLVSRWGVTTYAWSDPPFIAFVCLALLVMAKSLEKDSYLIWYFALAGLLSGLAASTRLIGVTLLPCGVSTAILIAFNSGKNSKSLWCAAKLTSALTLGFLAPMATWTTYNWINAGYLMKALRIPSQTGLLTNVGTVAKGIFIDLWPILALTLLAYLLVGQFSVRGFLAYFRAKDALRKGQSRNILFVASCWIICYCAFLAIMATIVDIHDMRFLDTRLFVPVYPLLIVILSAVMCSAYSSKLNISRIPRLLSTAFILIAIILGVKHFLWEVELTKKCNFENYELYKWIRQETNPDDLFIGRRVWHIRFYSGRMVLGSGYPEMPLLTPEAVTTFLNRFEKDYNSAYFVHRLEWNEKFSPEDVAAYNQAGFDLRPCGVFNSYEKEVEVYRILKTAARSDPGPSST